MEYVDFEKEFVERTMEIVKNQCNGEFEYDVTLLLNCILGLVSLPTECTRNISEKDINFKNACIQKLKDMDVIIKESSDNCTFRAMKNALSHMHISSESRNGQIESIQLWDQHYSETKPHTKLEFTVLQLKDFALFVAEKYLERFKV